MTMICKNNCDRPRRSQKEKSDPISEIWFFFMFCVCLIISCPAMLDKRDVTLQYYRVSVLFSSHKHKHDVSSCFFEGRSDVCNDACIFQCLEMILVIGLCIFIFVASECSRKHCSEFCSANGTRWIEFGRICSHQAKLTSQSDISFKFCALIGDVFEITFLWSIWFETKHFDRIIYHHFGHVYSRQFTSKISLLDSWHCGNSYAIGIEVCII